MIALPLIALLPPLLLAQSSQPALGGVDAQLESLHREMSVMLRPNGLLEEDGYRAAARLVKVAEKSGGLARSAIGDLRKLDASNLEMRAYNALVHDALGAGHQIEADYRLAQLRSTAEQTRQIPHVAAAEAGR